MILIRAQLDGFPHSPVTGHAKLLQTSQFYEILFIFNIKYRTDNRIVYLKVETELFVIIQWWD